MDGNHEHMKIFLNYISSEINKDKLNNKKDLFTK